MSFLEKVISRLHSVFTPPETREESEDSYLCVFLKVDSDFVFVEERKRSDDPKCFKPILIPLHSLGRIEDKFFKINNFMFEEFDISPENIKIAREFLSLAPLSYQTFYFAVVDICVEDLKNLKNTLSFENAKSLSLPYITVKANKNFFFNMLLKLIEDPTYIQ